MGGPTISPRNFRRALSATLPKIASNESTPSKNIRSFFGSPRRFFDIRSAIWPVLILLLCALAAPAPARAQQSLPDDGAPAVPTSQKSGDKQTGDQKSDDQQSGDQQSGVQQIPANISGTVTDSSGAAVTSAHVKLVSSDPSQNREVVTTDDGQFSFANIAPGPFGLTVTAPNFATQSYNGNLTPGEICIVPAIVLALAAEVTKVVVSVPQVEVAEVEIKEEEKQRILGVIPNFYVSYEAHPVPLTSKQKYELAWKTTIDPVTFVLNGAIAGFQQVTNEFSEYGQGAEGYGKRFGASYANLVTGTFIEAAILPSLLKQDPRYFYKGTGTTRSRVLYALANAVICKGDNGRWQPNYSGLGGGLAAGGISNLYYPPQYRGWGLTFVNWGLGIGEGAATNILEEFIVPKFTPHLAKHQQPDKS